MTSTMLSLLTALTLASLSGVAEARSGYLSDFNDSYGTTSTALDACATCHGASKSARNDYGFDFETELLAGSDSLTAMVDIEAIDSDGDGYSNIDEIVALTLPGDASSFPTTSCTDVDGDGWCDTEDCDDTDAAVNPDASESCNGVDDNCDGNVDEGVLSVFYYDYDGDGYGDAVSWIEDCSAPLDYVSDGSDCDDTDPSINLGAAEVCDDGLDNDCDSFVDCDDGDCSADAVCGSCTDADADGYCDDVDCDDADPAVNPGAGEVCDDSFDNDCDLQLDCDDADCDGDAACATGSAEGKGKTCRDGADNDLDGWTDCDDPDCATSKDCASGGGDPGGDGGATSSGSEGKGKTCRDGTDNDGDGLTDCSDPDCSGSRDCG